MKRLVMVVLLPLIAGLLSGGCGRYIIALEGKLDKSTQQKIRPISDSSSNVAIYLDKAIREKVVVQKAEGASCGHAYSEVPIGPAFSNTLIEALRLTFPNMRLVEAPERPAGFILLKISVEKVETGFEYSALGGCAAPAMDRGRISGSFFTEIINAEGKTIFEEAFNFREEERDAGTPPASQAGVLQNCMNNIAVKYIRTIKKKFEI